MQRVFFAGSGEGCSRFPKVNHAKHGPVTNTSQLKARKGRNMNIPKMPSPSEDESLALEHFHFYSAQSSAAKCGFS